MDGDGGLDDALAARPGKRERDARDALDRAILASEQVKKEQLARASRAAAAFLEQANARKLSPDVVEHPLEIIVERRGLFRRRVESPIETETECFVLVPPVGGVELGHGGLVLQKSGVLTGVGGTPATKGSPPGYLPENHYLFPGTSGLSPPAARVRAICTRIVELLAIRLEQPANEYLRLTKPYDGDGGYIWPVKRESA